MEYQAKRNYKTYLTINSIIDSTLSTYSGVLCHSTQVQCVEYLCKFLANNKMEMYKTAGSKKATPTNFLPFDSVYMKCLSKKFYFYRFRNGEFVNLALFRFFSILLHKMAKNQAAQLQMLAIWIA